MTPMNDLSRLQFTVRILHRMYGVYEQAHIDSGVGAGRMTFEEWTLYMLGFDWTNKDQEYRKGYNLYGIIWPQQDGAE